MSHHCCVFALFIIISLSLAESKLWLYMLNAGPYTVELKVSVSHYYTAVHCS